MKVQTSTSSALFVQTDALDISSSYYIHSKSMDLPLDALDVSLAEQLGQVQMVSRHSASRCL